MANTQSSTPTSVKAEVNHASFEEASVDTDPGASGYGCNPVLVRDENQDTDIGYKTFYISSIGTGAIVSLQWKRNTASTWTDFEDFTTVTRQIIQEQALGVHWRGVVKDNNQGSAGASVFGICW